MIIRIFAGLLASAAFLSLALTAPVASAQLLPGDGPIPEDAWRDVDPENLVLIDTAYGVIGVELYPEIAPNHAERIKALARSKFYDNVPFHRVIEGFMNQTGDGTNGDGTGDSELPDLDPEFTFRRSTKMNVALAGKRDIKGKLQPVGFYKALPVTTQPISQAFLTKDGKVAAHALHCKGVTSMARTANPSTGNSQFFLMRDISEGLDAQYSIWGNTVMGFEFVEKPKVGTVGDDPSFVPDRMNTVRVAADLPEAERPRVQVMKTDGAAFEAFLNTQRKLTTGKFPDICDIKVPTRTL